MENNELNLREAVKHALEPTFNAIIDNVLLFTNTLNKSLPDDMPMQQKQELIESLLQQHSAAMTESFKAGVPKEFEQKLKEAVNVKQ